MNENLKQDTGCKIQDAGCENTAPDEVMGCNGHRRNGKVARLPKVVREQINELIDDGVTYDEIIKRLGDQGKGLTKHHVSEWARGGYRDWVKEQERKVLLAGNFERVVDALAKADVEEIPDLVIKLLAARMGGVLSEITPQDLQQNSEKHPQTLARLLALVPKLSREALRTRKFRREVAKEEAATPKQRDPNKPFGDESDHRAVVRVVDHVLGLDRFKKQMMEADAAAGRPWPSQMKSSATSNVAPTTNADTPPIPNRPPENLPSAG